MARSPVRSDGGLGSRKETRSAALPSSPTAQLQGVGKILTTAVVPNVRFIPREVERPYRTCSSTRGMGYKIYKAVQPVLVGVGAKRIGFAASCGDFFPSIALEGQRDAPPDG